MGKELISSMHITPVVMIGVGALRTSIFFNIYKQPDAGDPSLTVDAKSKSKFCVILNFIWHSRKSQA